MGAIAGCVGTDSKAWNFSGIEKTMACRGPGKLEEIIHKNGVLIRNMEPSGGASQVQGKDAWELTFSGRLDNQEEIRRELQQLGIPDPGENTGKLVLQSFRQWGMDCLGRFRGPFAFALWESLTGKLYFARDQMGMEPLFYRQEGKTLLFASEIKTILVMPGVKAELDMEGAAQLILLGPGRKPDSGVFRGIRALEPGCWAVFENGKLEIKRYWYLKDQEHRENFADTAEHIRELVLRSIRRQVTEEAGTFLSGGLDSSIISAVCGKMAWERGERLQTFSVD